MISIPKPRKIKSPKIRKSAKGEACTLQTPVCSHNRDEVVFCHAPSEGKGMRTKSDDYWGAYGCNNCHQYLDQNKCSESDRRFYWMRGIYRTLKRLIEKGIWKL